MLQKNQVTIDGITLKLTCGACPEQYDAFDATGKHVGYLRLRNGYFRVDYPNCGGKTIYDSATNGDGIFNAGEREQQLNNAVRAINIQIDPEKYKGTTCPNCGSIQ